MGLLTLVAAVGSTMTISCEGDDADKAVPRSPSSSTMASVRASNLEGCWTERRREDERVVREGSPWSV